MTDLIELEYKVRVRRIFYVTRYCKVGDENSDGSSSSEEGTFGDPLTALRAAQALADAERKTWGIPEGDPRIKYTGLPDDDAHRKEPLP